MPPKAGKNSEAVKVVVRCRPLNSTEQANGNHRCAAAPDTPAVSLRGALMRARASARAAGAQHRRHGQ